MRAPGSPPPPETPPAAGPQRPEDQSQSRSWWQSRWPWLAGGSVLVAALIAVIVILAIRPAASVPSSSAPQPTLTPAATPTPAATATPAGTATPVAVPSATASTETAADRQQHFRTYVSTVLVDGSALASATAELQQCIEANRNLCEKGLSDARARITSFQTDLAANPPPSCLGNTDLLMRAGLGFDLRGIDLARQGIKERNRLKVVQGTLLIAAGTFRTGQAVRAARTANC